MELGIPTKLIILVKSTMTNVQFSVHIQSHLSQPISTTRGVRQGDVLACLLFNIALEKVIRDSGIQTRGTIFFKTVQILAYADDIDLMAGTTPGLSEAFLNLEKSARNMGLVINQEKTVYTGCPRRNVPDFGRVFLMLKYTDITQNTYNQS